MKSILLCLAVLFGLPAVAAAQCDVTVDTFAELETEIESRTTSAADGDVICIDAGVYNNAGATIVLQNRPSAADFVTITTTGGCAERRMTADDLGDLAVLVLTGSSTRVLETEANANWWKFECIGFDTSGVSEEFALNIIGGLTESVVGNRAYKIHFDRIVYADQEVGNVRQFTRVALVEDFSLTRSYCGDVLLDGTDTMCAAMVNAYCQPCTYDDNYIGAATEPIFAQTVSNTVEAPTGVINIVPTDITITDNYFYKNLAYQVGGAGTGTHKHHIEFKAGLNITIARNVFWNNWAGPGHGTGPSILLSPRTELTCTDCGASNATITNNVFYNVSQCLQVGGEDSSNPTEQVTGNYFTNNVCEYTYNCVYYGQNPDDLVFSDNTCVLQSGSPGGTPNAWMKWADEDDPETDVLVANDNIVLSGAYGILGDFVGEAALEDMVIDWTFTGNVIAGVEDYGNIGESDYPDGQTFITSETLETIFTDFAGRVYCVSPMSPYYGKGADCSLIPSLASGDEGGVRIRFKVSE